MDLLSKLAEQIAKSGERSVYDRFAHADLMRALQAFVEFSGLSGNELPDEGWPFIVGHLLGAESALRRASIALSDPRARGVERDVFTHLEEGLDIEDALRRASAPPKPVAVDRDRDPVVIPFPKRSE